MDLKVGECSDGYGCDPSGVISIIPSIPTDRISKSLVGLPLGGRSLLWRLLWLDGGLGLLSWIRKRRHNCRTLSTILASGIPQSSLGRKGSYQRIHPHSCIWWGPCSWGGVVRVYYFKFRASGSLAAGPQAEACLTTRAVADWGGKYGYAYLAIASRLVFGALPDPVALTRSLTLHQNSLPCPGAAAASSFLEGGPGGGAGSTGRRRCCRRRGPRRRGPGRCAGRLQILINLGSGSRGLAC